MDGRMCLCPTSGECNCSTSRFPAQYQPPTYPSQPPTSSQGFSPPPYYNPLPVYPQATPGTHIPFPGSMPSIQQYPGLPASSVDGSRKRTLGDAGHQAQDQPTTKKPRKKKQPVPRASSRTNNPVSVTAAPTCGVGPITPQIPDTNSGSTDSAAPSSTATDAPRPSQSESSVYQQSSGSSSTAPEPSTPNPAHKNSKPNSATDVYFFVRPLKSDIQPEKIPEAATPQMNSPDIIKEKPSMTDYPWLGCRLCSRWHVWKNASGGVTSNIRRHLQDVHGDVYYPVVKRLGLKHSDDDTKSKADEKFSLEGWIDRLIRWIVADDQSIRVVDCQEFRDFELFGREETEADLPHRTAATNHVLKKYHVIHEALIEEMKHAYGRIHFTGDAWSTGDLSSHFAISGHFTTRDANGNLIVANRLLAFRIIEGKHDGENLARIAFGILKDAGILNRGGMWTFDNASNMDTLMPALGRLIASEPGVIVEFDPVGNRIRCFPHIINIATQTVLTELKDNPIIPVLNSSSSLRPDKLSAYADALSTDPVDHGRKIVAACRASGQRRKGLKDVINQGNATKCWPTEGGVLNCLQLLRDCDTRWSSTYNMNDRVIVLHPYPENRSLADLLFSEEQFQVLNDIQLILSLPHLAQELLSAEKTPTLSMALPAFELLLLNWLCLMEELPELAHYIGVGVHKIQEYVHKGRKSRIYALAMSTFQSIHCLHFSIEEHWPREDAVQAEKWIVELMTSFATARRHENKRKQPKSPTLEKSVVPSLRPAAAQASGFKRLANFQINRRIVSLPRSPFTGTDGSTSTTPRLPTTAPSPSPAAETPGPSTPALSADEEAELERTALEDDARTAKREWNTYRAAPLEVSDETKPLNLVRFWDVSGLVEL
ncbi:ribonuclease H-like domain-containing protein [Favolaschia claudopus]|uniref:Ribonuclease H-like domain-containing protein n=1 Tax=Favolaschia claudopus TaxID=2862362 RepID=A0AAV9ZYX0_9AGAR